MDEMQVRLCTESDLAALAAFNKQLIEDEAHDNPMNLAELEARMLAFIQTEYRAYFFIIKNEVVGYALVNHMRKPLYLRQFYIGRSSRRMGYGTQAFHALTALLGTDELDIEVMFWNQRGHSFWKALGFRERSVYMRSGRRNGE